MTEQRDVLAEYGLCVDDDVRFRHREEQNWTKGRVLGVGSKDFSVTLVDDGGHMRSIMPDKMQKRIPGPRGGKLWVEVVDETKDDTSE